MIITIYILVILLLMSFGIMQYLYYIKLYYTNNAIIKLRALENEAIIYLSENVQNATLEESESIRNFILVVSASIDKLSLSGTINFKILKALTIIIIACINQIRYVEKKMSDGNPKLADFAKKYWEAMGVSFEAIPFLRVRMILYLAKWISGLLLSLGVGKCRKLISALDTLNKANNDISNHCIG